MTLRRLLAAAALALTLTACGAAASDIQTGAIGPSLAATGSSSAAPRTVGVPTRITIPRLGITDEVVPVGLAPDGSLAVPAVDESGWFDKGPKPGEVGGSLIAGHVNWHGELGALGRIGELHSGDIVIVKDASGIERVFGVYDVKSVPKSHYAAVTSPLVFAPRSTADLSLVTCSGTVHNGEYSDNTVVRTRLAA